MSEEVYERLRSKVDLAVMEWQEWLKTEAKAEDFTTVFREKPWLSLERHEEGAEGEIWNFDIADAAEGSLALRLHRERNYREADNVKKEAPA